MEYQFKFISGTDPKATLNIKERMKAAMEILDRLKDEPEIMPVLYAELATLQPTNPNSEPSC